MRTPQVPSHALTNRDVKQMFRCRPFFRPLWESGQSICPLNHADRLSSILKARTFDDRVQEDMIVIRKLNYISGERNVASAQNQMNEKILSKIIRQILIDNLQSLDKNNYREITIKYKNKILCTSLKKLFNLWCN